ncbi:MAG: hypothetical protein OEW00_14325, partial [candidate division Zixibacteria bacterium]|nr:hypothetical protein [candidate division Zixibacteria bacterium]
MFRSLATFCLMLCALTLPGESVRAQYTCGDANGDEVVSIPDVTYISSYVFGGGPEPSPFQAGNADGCMSVNIADAVRIFRYIWFSDPLGNCESTIDCSAFVPGNSVRIGSPPYDVYPGDDSVAIPVYITNSETISGLSLGFTHSNDSIQ